MENYRLTLKDKLYFLFVKNYYKRYSYLFSKVEKHQKEWFRYYNINFPYDFNEYLKSYINYLIFEYQREYE